MLTLWCLFLVLCLPSEPTLVWGKSCLQVFGVPTSVIRTPSSSHAPSGSISWSASGLSVGAGLSLDRIWCSQVAAIMIIATGNSQNNGGNKKNILLRSSRWLFKGMFNHKERQICMNEQRKDIWVSGILLPGWLCLLRCGLGPFLVSVLANDKSQDLSTGDVSFRKL